MGYAVSSSHPTGQAWCLLLLSHTSSWSLCTGKPDRKAKRVRWPSPDASTCGSIGNLSPYRRFGNWFLDKAVKFGYQTWRAALGLAVVFVAFLIMTFFARHHHAIVPMSDLAVGVHPVPVATQCTSSYPCFYPLGYADVVVPVINVHQADHWALNGWRWVAASWVPTVLGWTAVTLLVVGYTGLVRQD